MCDTNMDFTKISIKRPVAIIMVMLIVVILGIVSVSKMEMALTPDVDMPIVMVMTTYEDAGPEEVESLVTEKIESAIANVEDVESISSTSSEGTSMVMVEFTYGTNLDTAVTNLRDKLSMAEAMLPDDCDSPTIMKMDSNSMPVLTAVVASDSMDEYELKTFVEDNIEPRLERQSGVASVDVMGGAQKEIRIEIDQELLEGYGLTMTSIGQILSSENSNQSGGTIDYGDKTLTISTKLQMQSIEDIKKTPIQISEGTVLKLEDIATITECEKETESISRYNGEQCISVSVTKTSDGNTVSVVEDVRKEIEAISRDYPEITMEVTSESASSIQNSIDNVLSNIYTGAILSIIGTFVLLYFSGTTLNMISLGGLSVGVGMLVDHSVVVLENIYRYRTTLGYGKIKGIYRAGKEVRASIVASTLTTIVVFVPFVFVTGMMIEMMRDLAYAIIFALVMSLVTSMTVVPMFAGNYVNNIHRNHAPKQLDFINKLLDLFDRFIKNWMPFMAGF